MNIDTSTGIPVQQELLHNYFKNLVNHFFKILPMRENNETTLITYMRSLQIELLGCKNFISAMQTDSNYLSLLSILQYLIDYSDCSVHEVKREVFRAISICNKLRSTYFFQEVRHE